MYYYTTNAHNTRVSLSNLIFYKKPCRPRNTDSYLSTSTVGLAHSTSIAIGLLLSGMMLQIRRPGLLNLSAHLSKNESLPFNDTLTTLTVVPFGALIYSKINNYHSY